MKHSHWLFATGILYVTYAASASPLPAVNQAVSKAQAMNPPSITDTTLHSQNRLNAHPQGNETVTTQQPSDTPSFLIYHDPKRQQWVTKVVTPSPEHQTKRRKQKTQANNSSIRQRAQSLRYIGQRMLYHLFH